MKHSVEEKRKFHANGQPKGGFSDGYCLGVRWYKQYGKLSIEDKKNQLGVIDNVKQIAKSGDAWGKGIMCAIRDCANERKERQKKK